MTVSKSVDVHANVSLPLYLACNTGIFLEIWYLYVTNSKDMSKSFFLLQNTHTDRWLISKDRCGDAPGAHRWSNLPLMNACAKYQEQQYTATRLGSLQCSCFSRNAQ